MRLGLLNAGSLFDSTRKTGKLWSLHYPLYEILRPHVAHLDIWETSYVQALEGDNAAVEWIKGSALKPLLDVLDDDEAKDFFAAYSALAQKAYPKRADGKTLYPFRRVFVVAGR